jgi:hypothetical protein
MKVLELHESTRIRQQWPFKDMKAEEVCVISGMPRSGYRKAQLAAHSYASMSGKKFVTKSAGPMFFVWRVK